MQRVRRNDFNKVLFFEIARNQNGGVHGNAKGANAERTGWKRGEWKNSSQTPLRFTPQPSPQPSSASHSPPPFLFLLFTLLLSLTSPSPSPPPSSSSSSSSTFPSSALTFYSSSATSFSSSNLHVPSTHLLALQQMQLTFFLLRSHTFFPNIENRPDRCC